MATEYPRTQHLPCSPQVADDDVIRCEEAGTDPLLQSEVVITEKLDGGNCCLRDGKVYARTHGQEAGHASFEWTKGFYSTFSYHPMLEGYGLYGENLQGIHSIEYSALKSFFYLFGIKDEASDEWLSYDEMLKFTADLYEETGIEIPTAPLIYRGAIPSMTHLAALLAKEAALSSMVGGVREGFVVRCAGRVPVKDFSRKVAKYVRKGHVQTAADWKRTWKAAKMVAE